MDLQFRPLRTRAFMCFNILFLLIVPIILGITYLFALLPPLTVRCETGQYISEAYDCIACPSQTWTPCCNAKTCHQATSITALSIDSVPLFVCNDTIQACSVHDMYNATLDYSAVKLCRKHGFSYGQPTEFFAPFVPNPARTYDKFMPTGDFIFSGASRDITGGLYTTRINCYDYCEEYFTEFPHCDDDLLYCEQEAGNYLTLSTNTCFDEFKVTVLYTNYETYVKRIVPDEKNELGLDVVIIAPAMYIADNEYITQDAALSTLMNGSTVYIIEFNRFRASDNATLTHDEARAIVMNSLRIIRSDSENRIVFLASDAGSYELFQFLLDKVNLQYAGFCEGTCDRFEVNRTIAAVYSNEGMFYPSNLPDFNTDIIDLQKVFLQNFPERKLNFYDVRLSEEHIDHLHHVKFVFQSCNLADMYSLSQISIEFVASLTKYPNSPYVQTEVNVCSNMYSRTLWDCLIGALTHSIFQMKFVSWLQTINE
ncbi:hypothetical protein PCE1_001510 [Barthelona sp. PCE]